MPGPLPSATHQRARDTRRRLAPSASLTADDVVRGPDLVEATGRDDWHPGTLRWYETWRTSPQAQAFLPTDWERLLLIAPLHDVIARNPQRPSTSAIAELRLNEERLGATYADRARLRMQVVTAARPGAASTSAHRKARTVDV